MLSHRPVLLLVLASAVTGCGDDEGPTSPLDEKEVLHEARAGVVSIATYSDGAKGFQFTVRPSFIEAEAAARCTIEEVGTCRKISCPTDRANIRTQSAGAVHIKAGSNTADMIPDFNGYTNVRESRSFFAGGESLSISADGATVPSFSAVVTAPSPLLVTAPLDSPLAVSRSQDLTVSWTGSTAGVVVFQLAGKIDSTDVKLQCRFLPEGGTGIVPAAAIATLKTGQYTANLFSRSRSVVTTGGWSVLMEGAYFAGVKDVGAYELVANVD